MTRLHIALPLALLATHAHAHAFLDGAQPRVGSQTAVPPAEVVLHFTQSIEPAFSRLDVQDSTGRSVTAGTAHEGADATSFAVSVQKLPPGTYTVTWHATSTDMHRTQGTFHFTITR